MTYPIIIDNVHAVLWNMVNAYFGVGFPMCPPTGQALWYHVYGPGSMYTPLNLPSGKRGWFLEIFFGLHVSTSDSTGSECSILIELGSDTIEFVYKQEQKRGLVPPLFTKRTWTILYNGNEVAVTSALNSSPDQPGDYNVDWGSFASDFCISKQGTTFYWGYFSQIAGMHHLYDWRLSYNCGNYIAPSGLYIKGIVDQFRTFGTVCGDDSYVLGEMHLPFFVNEPINTNMMWWDTVIPPSTGSDAQIFNM